MARCPQNFGHLVHIVLSQFTGKQIVLKELLTRKCIDTDTFCFQSMLEHHNVMVITKHLSVQLNAMWPSKQHLSQDYKQLQDFTEPGLMGKIHCAAWLDKPDTGV